MTRHPPPRPDAARIPFSVAQQILQLDRDGYSKTQIARRVDFAVETVDVVLRCMSTTPPPQTKETTPMDTTDNKRKAPDFATVPWEGSYMQRLVARIGYTAAARKCGYKDAGIYHMESKGSLRKVADLAARWHYEQMTAPKTDAVKTRLLIIRTTDTANLDVIKKLCTALSIQFRDFVDE
jgi:hypothetical protein